MLQHAHLLGFGVRSGANNEPVQYLLGEGKRDKPAVVIHFILQGCDGSGARNRLLRQQGRTGKWSLRSLKVIP